MPKAVDGLIDKAFQTMFELSINFIEGGKFAFVDGWRTMAERALSQLSESEKDLACQKYVQDEY